MLSPNFISTLPSGSSVACTVDRARRVEAAHAAPGHGERDRPRRCTKTPPARRRIEIGEERRDARRPAEQAREVALGADAVSSSPNVMLPSELTNTRAAPCRRTGTKTASSGARVVVGQRHAAAERSDGTRIDARHVVAAGAVAREAQRRGCADRTGSDAGSTSPSSWITAISPMSCDAAGVAPQRRRPPPLPARR